MEDKVLIPKRHQARRKSMLCNLNKLKRKRKNSRSDLMRPIKNLMKKNPKWKKSFSKML